MTAPVTETPIDRLKAECNESALLERAVSDCIEALMRRTVAGRSISDAITRLDQMKQIFEETADDRPIQTIRIRFRRT